MKDRAVAFALGAVAAVLVLHGPLGLAAETTCRIEDGPYAGETGVLVNGRCLRGTPGETQVRPAAPALPAPGHRHEPQDGMCPVCGAAGAPFLNFTVQGGARPGQTGPALETKALLRCGRCGCLFTPLK